MKKSLGSIKDTCINQTSLINKDLRLDENEERKRNITFSFVVFKTKSVKCEKFNNFFETRKSAITSNGCLMKALGDLSRRRMCDLDSDIILKQRYRYHSIDGDEEIRKIAKILKEEYGFNEDFVNQQENSYYQFEYAPNGNRIVITKVGSVFIPLFLDNNHFVYYNACDNKEQKMKYKIPSVISDDYLKICDEKDDFEFCRMLIEDYKNGSIKTKDEFFAQWDKLYGE